MMNTGLCLMTLGFCSMTVWFPLLMIGDLGERRNAKYLPIASVCAILAGALILDLTR